MSDATLLPCPFCGGVPVGIEHPPHKHVFATFMPDHPGSYTIECPSCNAGMIDSTEDACVAAWNSRTAEREVAELRAALKSCIQTLKVENALKPDYGWSEFIANIERAMKGKP